MKTLLEKLRAFRHEMWKALSGDAETSWVAHFMLVSLGTFIPAGIVGAIWGGTPGIVAAFALSEAWLLFMSGREVVDYLRHLWAQDPKKEFIRDGIGDLVGPVIVHLICWAGLLAVIFGG